MNSVLYHCAYVISSLNIDANFGCLCLKIYLACVYIVCDRIKHFADSIKIELFSIYNV